MKRRDRLKAGHLAREGKGGVDSRGKSQPKRLQRRAVARRGRIFRRDWELQMERRKAVATGFGLPQVDCYRPQGRGRRPLHAGESSQRELYYLGCPGRGFH